MAKAKGDKLFTGFDQVMDDLFGGLLMPKTKTTKAVETQVERTSPPGVKSSMPTYRTTTSEGSMTLEVDLTGIDPKSVMLESLGNVIVVRYNRGEVGCKVQYTLGDGYDAKTAKAIWKLGQLRLTVLGSENPQRVAIPIDIQ